MRRKLKLLGWAIVLFYGHGHFALMEAGEDVYPRFLLRTTKNYVALPGPSETPTKFELTMGVLDWDHVNNTIIWQPSTGDVEFEVRELSGLAQVPDVSGFVPLETMLAWPSVLYRPYVTGGTLPISVIQSDEIPQPKAAIIRARPYNSNVAWSEWVQVNYGTRYGLLETKLYYPSDPNYGPEHFYGVNYVVQVGFETVIGNRPIHDLHPSPKIQIPEIPLPIAEYPYPGGEDHGGWQAVEEAMGGDAMQYFLKNSPYGYHNPTFPWWTNDPNHNSPWERGETNAVLPIQASMPYPNNHWSERWHVYNAYELYDKGVAAWGAPGWDNPDYIRTVGNYPGRPVKPTDPWYEKFVLGRTADVMEPANSADYLRNYMLAPEYVGRGWGISVNWNARDYSGRTYTVRNWSVNAQVHLAKDLKRGFNETQTPILQLRYFENFDSSYAEGHREDWFLSPEGIVRIEGRKWGPRYDAVPDARYARLPAVNDPDIWARELIAYPHYRITRDEDGHNDNGADLWPPKKPLGLSLQAISSTHVGLSWFPAKDNAPVPFYKIYRNNILIATPSTSHYQDQTVSPKTTYTYAVTAYDHGGNESPRSDSLVVTTDPVPNTPPQLTSPPVASPNPLTLPSSTALSVSASDSDGPAGLSYTWSSISGPGSVSFSPNGTAAAHSCTATFDAAGLYIVRVTVSDGLDSVAGEISITVTDPPPVEVIVDNQDGNVSTTGTWKPSSGANPYEGQSLYSVGASRFRWIPGVIETGTYDVYAWWTYHDNRSSKVPYRIRHKHGVTTKVVNQHDPSLGGRWNRIGSVAFLAGSDGYVEVSGENGQASADAIRLVRVPGPPPELIIDNRSPFTSFTGGWSRSSGPNPYNGESLYANSDATFRWSPKLGEPASYEVFAHWTYHANRSSAVPYRIQRSGGQDIVVVDMHDPALGGKWNSLGQFTFSGSDDFVEVSAENGQACADAIRFVRIH